MLHYNLNGAMFLASNVTGKVLKEDRKSLVFISQGYVSKIGCE